MFDSLVVTQTQKPGTRTLLGLPAAVALHVAVGLVYFAANLFAMPEVAPPPYPAILELPATPVVLVRKEDFERRQNPGAQEQKKDRQANDLVAPDDTPSELPPPGEDPATGPGGPPVPDDAWVVDDLPDDYRDPVLSNPVRLVRECDMLQPPRLLSRVNPTYPRALEVMGVGGRVVLEVEVDEAGAVASVRVLASPHPLLSQAAEEAVRQWRYTRPMVPGGGTARVVMTVNVTFQMR